jgi:hypothetical protein
MTYERKSRVYISDKEYNALIEAKDILRKLYAIDIIPYDDDEFRGEVYDAFDGLVVLLDTQRLVASPYESDCILK